MQRAYRQSLMSLKMNPTKGDTSFIQRKARRHLPKAPNSPCCSERYDPDKTSREHDEVNQHQTLKEAIIELREEVKQMKYMLMMLMICVSLCLAVFAMSPKMRDVANRNRIEVNFDLAG